MTVRFSLRFAGNAVAVHLWVPSQREAPKTLDQSSDLDSASYLIGYQQMRSVIEQAGTHVNPDAFLLGTTDAIANTESQVALDRRKLAHSIARRRNSQ